jgi:hypothetical protein
MDAPDRVNQKAKPPGRVCSCQSRPTLSEALGFNLAGKLRTSRSWRVRDEALAEQVFDQDWVIAPTRAEPTIGDVLGVANRDVRRWNSDFEMTSRTSDRWSICIMFERLVRQSVILRGCARTVTGCR